MYAQYRAILKGFIKLLYSALKVQNMIVQNMIILSIQLT